MSRSLDNLITRYEVCEDNNEKKELERQILKILNKFISIDDVDINCL